MGFIAFFDRCVEILDVEMVIENGGRFFHVLSVHLGISWQVSWGDMSFNPMLLGKKTTPTASQAKLFFDFSGAWSKIQDANGCKWTNAPFSSQTWQWKIHHL